MKEKKTKGEKIQKYNTEKLLKKETMQKIKEEMDKKLEPILQEKDIQKDWDRLEKVMKESLQEKVGPRRPKENKDWFTEKCKRVLEELYQARLILLNRQTEENQKRYEAARKTTKRVCRQEKRENLIKKLRTIEESYQGVRKTREAENNDIPEKEELGMGSKRVRQAKDVFDEVLNTDSYEEQVEDLEPQENNEQKAVQEATEKEIEEELAKLKNNKSTGENGIPTEILKYAGGRLKSRVSALI
jgi:hypothetical protein